MSSNRRRRSYGMALGMVMGLCAVAGAEEQVPGTRPGAKDGEVKLEQIVVTATRTEKSLDSAPGSVSVVTREEIAKRNITTIDEALTATAGVVTTRGKGLLDSKSAITLRGIPSQARTLVMQDGITLNNPYSGSLLWLGVGPDSIEQIEVVKGPFSSLYGGYAMGGVINMITRMPEKREITLKTGYGSVLRGGSTSPENTRRVSVSYADSFQDKFRIFINNDYLATDGYRADTVVTTGKPTAGLTGWSPTTNIGSTALSTGYAIGNTGKNGAWQDNLTVKAEYILSPDTTIRLTFLKSIGEFNYDDPATYLRDAAGNQVWAYGGSGMGAVYQGTFLGTGNGSDQHLYNLGLETRLASTRIKLNVGYLEQISNWSVAPTAATATLGGGPGKASDTPAGAVSTDLQTTTPLFDRHLLTLGGSFRTGWADTKENSLANWQNRDAKGALTFQSKGSDRTYALFAQDEVMLLDNLTAYVGVRQDWWETFDGHINLVTSPAVNYAPRSDSSLSPKGALVYKPFEQTTLRASVGQAFRAPTVFELYRTVTMGAGGTYVGNPALKPENTTSWDIGVEQKFDYGTKLRATYFENYIKDLIYTTSAATGTGSSKIYNRLNAGKAESKGVELEAEVKPVSWLRLFANYTYTDAVIKENSADPATVGKRMTLTPEHMINVGTDLEYGQFGAYLLGQYVGKRYGNGNNSDTVGGVQGSYDPTFTLDLKLRYKLASWATASLAIKNLLDRQYYSYSQAPGRSWFGEVTFNF